MPASLYTAKGKPRTFFHLLPWDESQPSGINTASEGPQVPMTQPAKLFKSFKIQLHYISLLFALMHSAQLQRHVKQRSCRNELTLLLYRLLTHRLCHPELAESCPEIKPLQKRREFFSPVTANFTVVGCFCSLCTKDCTFKKYSFCEIFCDLRAV